MNEINVTIPGWMYDRFARIAEQYEKSVEDIALFIWRRGGSHPTRLQSWTRVILFAVEVVRPPKEDGMGNKRREGMDAVGLWLFGEDGCAVGGALRNWKEVAE